MTRRVRLVLLLAAAVLLQTAVFPHLRIGGAVPDIGLVLVVAVATREGVEAGAAMGFVTGLTVDLYLQTPLGLSALAFALTGAAVGVVQGFGPDSYPLALRALAGHLDRGRKA